MYYDDMAAATGWLGPQVAFGLMYEHVEPGQTMLDLGIGTGLSSVLFRKAGLRVFGLDADPEMLAICRRKGFGDLTQHDLTVTPYPFADTAFDHAVCLGVLPFLADPEPVFRETARVLEPGGLFAFLVLERPDGEPPELVVEAEQTDGGASATLLRVSGGEVAALVARHGFSAVAELALPVFQDPQRTISMPATVHLAQRR